MGDRWLRERTGRWPAWALTLVLTAVLTPGPAAGQQTLAADAFVDSVGVNVHLHYDYTPYKEQFELVKSRLVELGVRHVRDGLVDTEWQGYYDRHNELGDLGIKGTFITSFDQSVALMASYPSRVIRSFEAYEAPNEPDKSNHPQWVQKLWEAMLRLGQLKTIASVAHYQVVGPSLTHESSYGAVGDVSPYFDAANLHNYLAGRHPGTTGWGTDGYGSIDWNLRLIRPYSGGKPILTTEIGYQDAPGIQDRVPAEVVGRYLPRLLIEQFRAGIGRTFLYELYDFPNSGSYGLLHADGAPKPAFNAVKALLQLLADPGPPHSPQPLGYDIAHGGGDVRHLAFQKRDGSYLVAFWLEAPSFDVPAQRDTTTSDQAATLNLSRPMRILRAHRWQADGSATMTPVRRVTASMPVDVSDYLTVVEIAEGEPVGAPGVPGAVVPTVSGRDVRLRWEPPAAGGDPVVYRLDVGTEPTLTASLSLTVAAPVTELFAPGTPAGTYFVRVRAANAAGVGAPSASVPVLVGVPGPPVLVAERTDANPIALSWRPGPGAPPELYVLSAGSAPGAADLAVAPMALATRVVASVPTGVRFFVRVAAIAGNTVVRSNEVSFSVGARAPPPPPTLAPPVVEGPTVSLSWSAAGDATSYYLVAGLSPTGPLLATIRVSGTHLTVPGVPAGTYYVAVVGVRDGVTGAASNVVRVDVR
jgi:hypothetical protein